MSNRAIAYVSATTARVSPEQLWSFVEDAKRFNALAGVTGHLIFDGTRFLQYLEGPEDGVHAAFERILISKSHLDVLQLCNGLVSGPTFATPMSITEIDGQAFDALLALDWNAFVRRGDARPTALDLLATVAHAHVLPRGFSD